MLQCRHPIRQTAGDIRDRARDPVHQVASGIAIIAAMRRVGFGLALATVWILGAIVAVLGWINVVMGLVVRVPFVVTAHRFFRLLRVCFANFRAIAGFFAKR